VEATKEVYAKTAESRRLKRRQQVYLPMPHGASPATRQTLRAQR